MNYQFPCAKKALSAIACILIVALLSSCAIRKHSGTTEISVPSEEIHTTTPSGETQSLLYFKDDLTICREKVPLSLCYYQDGANFFYTLTTPNWTESFPLRDGFDPLTIDMGLEIQDVNQDGMDDIIVELGLYGKTSPWNCFVHTQESKFTQVDGFSDLFAPRWSETSHMIIDSGIGGAADFWIGRYEIKGSALVLVERLRWEYIDGGAPLYTEERIIDGETIVVHDAVPESKIDLEYWYE